MRRRGGTGSSGAGSSSGMIFQGTRRVGGVMVVTFLRVVVFVVDDVGSLADDERMWMLLMLML